MIAPSEFSLDECLGISTNRKMEETGGSGLDEASPSLLAGLHYSNHICQLP